MNSILLVSALLCATASAVADDSYFPIKTKTGGEGVTEFESKWYGQSLERMKEPRLPEFAKDANAEVYRITVLPTWGNSIAVRVQKHGELYSLSARRLDGQAGYNPGKLVESKDIALGADDSKTLAALIQNLDFFQISTEDDVIIEVWMATSGLLKAFRKANTMLQCGGALRPMTMGNAN